MWFRAKVAYDGTGFYGFQRQGAFRSVQGDIETVLATVLGQSPTVYGAGRTDTGVHATGQVIAFDANWAHPTDALERAININLPRDIAVREIARCETRFSPRFEAVSRTYEYTAYVSAVRNPLRDRFACQIESVLDLDAMNLAAKAFLGEHDFAAFGSPTTDTDNTVRRVIRAEWRLSGDTLVFTIEANAFLYRMVRRIVNALFKVGRGKLTAADVIEALASKDQNRITGLAPACGLCLVNVSY